MVLPCVEAVDQGKYKIAYQIYKECFLKLENKYAKPVITDKLIRVLKQIRDK